MSRTRARSRNRHRSRTALVALPIAVTALTGCSAFVGDEPIPPEELEAVALGANGEVADVAARSIVVVTSDRGSPGRLLGTIVNRSDEAVEVELRDPDDTVVVEVPAGDLVALEEQEFLLQTVEEMPGSNVEIAFVVGGEQVGLAVPVRDGSLEAYAPYVPEG